MKTISIIVITLFMLTLGLAAVENEEREVTIKECQSFWYAAMDFQGSYEEIPAAVGKFIGEFSQQGLTAQGPLMGLYFNSPAQVEPKDLKWAIAFPVDKDAVVKEPLKKVEFNSKEIAVYMHIGPYEKTAPSYAKLMKHIQQNSYKMKFPCIEKYLNDPMQTKPEDLQTEIVIPIEK